MVFSLVYFGRVVLYMYTMGKGSEWMEWNGMVFTGYFFKMIRRLEYGTFESSAAFVALSLCAFNV